MSSIFRLAALILLFWMALAAQRQSPPAVCPTVLGIYPVDFKIDDPLNQRPRFEIRACNDGRGTVQLLGFKASAGSPSLVESGSPIELLIHTGTLIVVQMTAGSSSPTLVAKFQKGIPVLLGRESAVGSITYTEEHKNGDFAIITIPQKTYPDNNGKFPDVPPHRYRLNIWED
jgi:hypothetical protein